jgi:UPF0716 protein FxsA
VRLLLLLVGLAFLVVPGLELWLLVVLNRHLGLGPTIGLLLLTGAAGFWLARWQGWRTLQRVRSELGAGRMPSAALLDGALILAAALLLITPGLLTDAVGFLLLLPPTRFLLRRLLVWWFRKRLSMAVFTVKAGGAPPAADDPGTVEGRAVSVEDADRRLE